MGLLIPIPPPAWISPCPTHEATSQPGMARRGRDGFGARCPGLKAYLLPKGTLTFYGSVSFSVQGNGHTSSSDLSED